MTRTAAFRYAWSMNILLPALLALSLPNPAFSAERDDVVLKALDAELSRTFKGLSNAENVPLYYLAYELRDTRTYDLAAKLGAIQSENDRHYRTLDVDVRVGDRKFDNTHQIKGREAWTDWSGQHQTEVSADDDEAALRADVWLRTEDAFRDAVKRYAKVRTNKAVTAEEEDLSDDFSEEEPSSFYGKADMPVADANAWKARLKRLCAAMKDYPFLYESGIRLSAKAENRYILDSEGTRVLAGNVYIRLSYNLQSRTEDGMDLERYKNYDGDSYADLPSEETILADIRKSAAELQALLKAPLTEPYTGPAIVKSRAAGVYFHEIMGHRLEGHRQKMEDEGQTFKKMLGKPVTASFISVYDDPTLKRYGKTFLRGAYAFDDEGLPAPRLALIEDGILKSFLMSRIPIKGFAKSNGHGRRSSGFEVVPRMGNTIVVASATVSFPQLRERLIDEIKRQNKPYGLVFEDIAGGFTITQRYLPQSFKVIPLLVYRVYPDGRPDEPVRGVDIVGTPLMSFTKIIAAADDADVFNGSCGAESGWVPVSGVSPSVLFSELEVEKKQKSSEKPPILPPPFHDQTEGKK
ncbi:MAG: peptidase U62 [Elusimicrobia bacterium]|nr:peptidase U62 [Elusimicrobiota bacterium]